MRYAQRRIGSLRGRQILRSALLDNIQCSQHCLGQFGNDLGHEFGKEMRTLAAAEYEKVEWLVGTGIGIGRVLLGNHQRTNRIAGQHHFPARLFGQPGQIWKRRGNRINQT